MSKAIGLLIILWGLTVFFGEAVHAFERMLITFFVTAEGALAVTQEVIASL